MARRADIVDTLVKRVLMLMQAPYRPPCSRSTFEARMADWREKALSPLHAALYSFSYNCWHFSKADRLMPLRFKSPLGARRKKACSPGKACLPSPLTTSARTAWGRPGLPRRRADERRRRARARNMRSGRGPPPPAGLTRRYCCQETTCRRAFHEYRDADDTTPWKPRH